MQFKDGKLLAETYTNLYVMTITTRQNLLKQIKSMKTPALCIRDGFFQHVETVNKVKMYDNSKEVYTAFADIVSQNKLSDIFL